MILPQILKNKQTNHTKPKIIKPAQISGFITKKEKKAFPVAPFCHSVLHAACVPFHLSTGFYFPLLRILLVHLSCSLCYEGFILLWVSLLSFSWSQEEHRTTCVVTPHHLGLEPLSHTPAVSSSSPFDQYLSQLSTGISEKKNTTLEIVRNNTIHFLCTRKKNYQAWGTYDPKAGTRLLMYQALFQALYIQWLIQSLQWQYKNSLQLSPLYRWGNLRHRKVN